MIAKTILEQIGGRRFAAMTGSKDFIDMGNGLRMSLARNKTSANRLDIIYDAVTGGTAEALNSVAHDMAKTIYNEPGQYPTLESILQNATTGMVSGSLGGAAVGGTGRAINLKKRNMRRNKQTTTALVDQHGFAWEVLDYDPENKIAEVLSPNGKNTINVPDIEPDMIHSFSGTGVITFKANSRSRRP